MLLPVVHSYDDFLDLFKRCHAREWERIVFYCRIKKENNIRRLEKGLRTVPCDSPEAFIRHHCKSWMDSRKWDNDELRLKEIAVLEKTSREKQETFKKELESHFTYIQKVCPSYIQRLIQTYFYLRKTRTLDVNARYLIILEASQFYCYETVNFLNMIAACDKNNDLRLLAYQALVRMGESPWLSRKRKGKQRLSQIKKVDLVQNPTAFLQLISSRQELVYQSFDVFLSHSSMDESELLRLKSMLNRQGWTVYIDWVNDRVMLNRKNQNDDTWNALVKRMDQSKRMLFVLTDNSLNSDYVRHEVEYFKSTGKQVFIYKPTQKVVSTPSYLEGCPECIYSDGKLILTKTPTICQQK